MRKGLYALGIALAVLLAAPIAGAAANSSAQIVNCAGTPPWCFSPNPIRITVGSTVTWMNNTGVTHTATSTSGAWDTGNIAPGQASGPVAFNAVGTFAYRCSIHPSMTGSVIVSAAATATATPAASARPTATTRALAQSGGGIASFPLGVLLAVAGLVFLVVGGLWLRRRSA